MSNNKEGKEIRRVIFIVFLWLMVIIGIMMVIGSLTILEKTIYGYESLMMTNGLVIIIGIILVHHIYVSKEREGVARK